MILCLQVHKELQDTLAQIDAIRHEIRSISILNPGPLTQRLVDNPELKAADGSVTSTWYVSLLLIFTRASSFCNCFFLFHFKW